MELSAEAGRLYEQLYTKVRHCGVDSINYRRPLITPRLADLPRIGGQGCYTRRY